MIVDQLVMDRKAAKGKFTNDIKSDRPIRSVAKAVSWRVIGTLDTLIVSYLITGKPVVAASIASIDFVTKMILYFFHERIWNKVHWGR